MYRETWLEVDLDAISYNVETIKELCGKKIIAVLKANAYGCGDHPVVQTVVEAGAEMIAVSSLEEALVLRNEGYTGEVLILGATRKEDLPLVMEKGITITVYSATQIEAMKAYDTSTLKVHLKYDTGMNRIGFRSISELKEALKALLDQKVKVEGIFTHFACADSSKEKTDIQFHKFKEAVETLNYPFTWIHCDNSDASVSYFEDVTNACRLGISLYGISAYKKDLKHALSLYTRLFFIKHVPQGESIGYGATYQTKEEEIIGTIPIGYADGLIRENQGRCVYIEGEKAELVGRICMDQSMVRLNKEYEEGTLVEVFGPHLSIEDMADELHTIPYEIMCLISPRVTRRYMKNGKAIQEENMRLEYSSLIGNQNRGE